jgi:hypothetical protein
VFGLLTFMFPKYTCTVVLGHLKCILERTGGLHEAREI